MISQKCYDREGNKIVCDTSDYPYTEVMPAATFNMPQYLQDNMKYPEKARLANKKGRVIVKFVVEEDGTVSTVRIVKSVYPELDKEAMRVVTKMPMWRPGLQNGQAVRVYFNLPIVFKLE